MFDWAPPQARHSPSIVFPKLTPDFNFVDVPPSQTAGVSECPALEQFRNASFGAGGECQRRDQSEPNQADAAIQGKHAEPYQRLLHGVTCGAALLTATTAVIGSECAPKSAYRPGNVAERTADVAHERQELG